MSSWAGTSRISSDLIKRYIQPKCISDYSRYRNEFVRQIEALSKSNQREFCKRCDIIKKNIKEKDRELNHCYVKNLVTVKLIQNDNIKDFIEECPEIPECNKKYIPSANKGSVLKSGTKEACGRSGCKNERAETVNGKSQLGVDARTPKLESSQREGIVKQSSSHAQREVTKQTKESPQGQGDIKPPDNLDMTQVKESKQIDNDHSSTNVEEKQLSQPVSASDTLSSSELGIQASDLPSQTSSSGESNSDNTTQVEHLSKGDIQDLHAGNHTSDNNNPVRQAAASKIFEDQKAGDRGDVTYIPGRATGDLVSTVPHTAPSTLGDKAPVDVDKDRESPASEDIVTEESGSSVIVDGVSVDKSGHAPSHVKSTSCVCTDGKSNCDEARGEVAPCNKYLGVKYILKEILLFDMAFSTGNTADILQRASDNNGQALRETDTGPSESVGTNESNVNQMANHDTLVHANRGKKQQKKRIQKVNTL
ncbi:PIR protein [Plasmodium vivax]|nr:PIR protein [Plasmodium vivax]